MNANQEILINSRYRIEGIIAEGGCGTVCLGTDIQDNKQVAIKLEQRSAKTRLLKDEKEAYEILAGGTGIARLHYYGREGEFRVLVHDLLGPTLQDLFYHCNRRFSLKTVLMLADQLIERIEYMHSKLLIHRDIKPHNFLMGFGEAEKSLVYIVDFGMVSPLSKSNAHADLDGRGFCGTCRYSSISNHIGIEQSPRDDLEAVAYMLVYFARGSLPWQGIVGHNPAEDRKLVGLQKVWLTPEEICKGLPEEFAKHIRYVRSLSFDDVPSYAKMRGMYARLFARHGFLNDGIFDWDARRERQRKKDRAREREKDRESEKDRERERERKRERARQLHIAQAGEPPISSRLRKRKAA